jgi:phospholipid/cholesterol/gamma-HCH transport system substrate-binding protein
LFQKVKALREMAETFNKRSGTVMEEGRRSLVDISQAAIKVTRKFQPQAGGEATPAPPAPSKRPSQKRQ